MAAYLLRHEVLRSMRVHQQIHIDPVVLSVFVLMQRGFPGQLIDRNVRHLWGKSAGARLIVIRPSGNSK